MKTPATLGLLLLATTALADAPDIGKLNGSVSVDPNQEAGNVSTVNGSIQVGDHATVAVVSTVNGRILLGKEARAGALRTVNGGIDVGSGAHISGDATTVNGSLVLEQSADISGRLTNVNGGIRLMAAHVGGGIETVSGNIEVGSNSRVEGGLRVRKPSSICGDWCNWFLGWFSRNESPRPPVVVIAPGATVKGTLVFEREVKLYVSDRAAIGAVQGAKAVLYSGERSPT